MSLSLMRDRKPVTAYVHRLVLEAFVGPCPPDMECLHGDDVPDNNVLTNLRWGTKSENAQEAWINQPGFKPGGENWVGATLKETQVLTIRASQEPHATLARAYGVTPTCIRAIRARRTWKHIP
jgi:hypothetical protein